MRDQDKRKPWKVISEFVRIENQWLTIIGEQLQTDTKKLLEYWRAEKPDGLLIITIWNGQIILPKQMYRPGVARYTLDFCGGRLEKNVDIEDTAKNIVKREFNINNCTFTSLKPINQEGWDIDSSFTNVQLYVYIAELSPEISISDEFIEAKFSLNAAGTKKLLHRLKCLQCRAALQEWLRLTSL